MIGPTRTWSWWPTGWWKGFQSRTSSSFWAFSQFLGHSFWRVAPYFQPSSIPNSVAKIGYSPETHPYPFHHYRHFLYQIGFHTWSTQECSPRSDRLSQIEILSAMTFSKVIQKRTLRLKRGSNGLKSGYWRHSCPSSPASSFRSCFLNKLKFKINPILFAI